MNEAASVFLRADIQRQDGRYLAQWMRNTNVTRYLNEKGNISDELIMLAERAPEGMLSFHLNQRGSFFLICSGDGSSIGFIKLAPSAPKECEIVYAIGDESLWGRGYGRHALDLALNKAFFDMRKEKVTAKIRKENIRSIRAAQHCGMKPVREAGNIRIYEITFREYVEHRHRNG